MTNDTFIPAESTSEAYREALGAFGTGVTVVTARGPDGPVAMTANSFASVSLDPPLVLWCPAKGSRRHEAMVAAEDFIIHILAEDQQDLAAHFAATGHDFDGIARTDTPEGLVHLSGCLAAFQCRREAVHPGGDHSIVVGAVTRVWHRAGKGLLFKRGIYGGFSEPV